MAQHMQSKRLAR